MHLFDSKTREKVDTFAIPNAHNESFAQNFRDPTVNEVATDPLDPHVLTSSNAEETAALVDMILSGLPEDNIRTFVS